MDRFDNLQAFVAVVESGSFTAAADRLDIAKSVVSRRIAALEDRLGGQLLRRTTRNLHVTDAGQRFYEQSVQILGDLDEAESAVAHQKGELQGVLNVALPLAFAARHMADPIAEFSRRHPKVRFNLDLNDRRVDLLAEGADIALRIGKLEDSTLIARRLFEVRSVICGSPLYLRQHGVPETPEDLREHRCLAYGNLPDPGTYVCLDKNGNEHRVSVQTAMTATSGDFLNLIAKRDLGLVLQPTFIAGDAIKSGALVPVLTEYEWPVIPAYAVYPPTRHLSYRVRAFIDFLAETFSGTPPWDVACEKANARP
ncbi:LysR family transcriptional regulator [Woeseia oceani]|uniref:LysR family transcriptional regulator n=1 Tax=Woeseia oceani TaxID=1548547 RepID=A0A193LJ93_9GAMM|nr:LysR family transcriptional regulator [Woeseia oceani]ANO52518.1 LysR family transcriptional regulator [Woeseia oceani]